MNAPGNITGIPGGLYGPGNLVATDTGIHSHWARITGHAAGTARYAHEQIDDGDIAGAFAGTLADGFGTVGTSDETGYPAYELTGRQDVPTGAIVKLTPGGDLSFLTFTYDGAGDGSGTASRCGGGCGLAGAQDDTCFSLAVVCHTGEFSSATFAQTFDGAALECAFFMLESGTGQTALYRLMYWNEDKEGGAGYSPWEFDYIGGSGEVTLTYETTAGPSHGSPILTINDITLLTRCVGSDFTFTGWRRNGFTGGTPPDDPCASSDFLLKVACVCCPIEMWLCDGWYAVDDGAGGCVALLIDETNRCDTDIIILSGPYATEEEATAYCTPPSVPCTSTPSAAVIAVTAGSGVCATSLDGLTATIALLSPNNYSLKFADPNCGEREVDIFCAGDVWTASKPLTDACQGGISPTVTVIDSTHIRIDTTFGGALCGDCGNQTITVEITVTF